MSERPSPVRGMRDFLPEEARTRGEVIQRIRAVYEKFGYSGIETPVLEDLRFLLSGQGGENEKLIFKTLRRGLDPQSVTPQTDLADYGLRYDLTVPLARYFATNEAKLPSPFRAMQIGPVWRAERPQRGRYRQFVQCDIDLIGEPGLLAEVELVTATTEALGALGFRGFRVQLNDRRLLHRLLSVAGLAPESFGEALVQLDKIDKIGPSGVADTLVQRGFPPAAVTGLMSIIEASRESADLATLAGLLKIDDDREALDGLATIRDAAGASAADVRIDVDLTLVRGMGYYTGPIFEIQVEGMNSSVAGGGRYDQMIGRFLGRTVPACGFSIGFERIWELLRDRGAEPRRRLALLFDKDRDELATVLAVARELRQDGTSVSVVPARRGKSLRARLLTGGFTHEMWAHGDQEPRELRA
ncbi:histidine--tRNA ligase [Actinoplanes siamensis]|uniref:Histidine--tRNA ligase n=1 Tax=Actinoplanes siamensis TaxID=1223317 RepID=A0A919NAE6_9ACTN|nr:histidine--tRNA ligase [Actinoplanes siamensis]GIF07436.1 histidine--tRNA ligase [Actinoplanes siamensis]